MVDSIVDVPESTAGTAEPENATDVTDRADRAVRPGGDVRPRDHTDALTALATVANMGIRTSTAPSTQSPYPLSGLGNPRCPPAVPTVRGG